MKKSSFASGSSRTGSSAHLPAADREGHVARARHRLDRADHVGDGDLLRRLVGHEPRLDAVGLAHRIPVEAAEAAPPRALRVLDAQGVASAALDDVHADGPDRQHVGLGPVLVGLQLELGDRLVLRRHDHARRDVDDRASLVELEGADAGWRGQGQEDVAALRAADRARALAQPVQADDGQPAVRRPQARLPLGPPAVDLVNVVRDRRVGPRGPQASRAPRTRNADLMSRV